MKHIRLVQQTVHYKRGLLAALGLWGGYFAYLWPKMFWQNATGIFAGHPFVWADWSAHLTYAAPFAFRDPSDWFLAHPLLSSARFSYPFLPDAISGLLVRSGLSVVASFMLPSILMTVFLVYGLYRFAYLFTRSALASFVTLTGFFCSGGLGLLVLSDGKGMATNIPERGVYFMNSVVSELLPQRNFLFGIVILLLAIALVDRLSRSGQWRDAVALGLVAGLLSIIHPHSLMVLGVVSFCYFVSHGLRYIKQFAVYAAISATLLLLYSATLLRGGGGALPRWQFGWMSSGHNFLLFLALNFGVIIPLFCISVWRLRWADKPLVWSAILLFIGCHILVFQQWEWDNMKLLTYAYLFALLPVSLWLTRLMQSKIVWRRALALLLCCSLFASGAHDVWQATVHRTANQIVSSQELTMAQQLRSIIASGDVVLMSQRPNQPLAMFTGAQTVWGYDGWVWSYGLDSSKVVSDVASIYEGNNQAAVLLLEQYAIKYVVVDSSARAEYDIPEAFWRQYPVVYTDANGVTVYRIVAK